jgi:hypothetical protein
LEICGSPAEDIQHVTPAIGYYNSTPLTLVSDFNHLANKRATCRIFVDPLLTDRKSFHALTTNPNSETAQAASGIRDHGKTAVLDWRLAPG